MEFIMVFGLPMALDEGRTALALRIDSWGIACSAKLRHIYRYANLRARKSRLSKRPQAGGGTRTGVCMRLERAHRGVTYFHLIATAAG